MNCRRRRLCEGLLGGAIVRDDVALRTALYADVVIVVRPIPVAAVVRADTEVGHVNVLCVCRSRHGGQGNHREKQCDFLHGFIPCWMSPAEETRNASGGSS